MTHHNCSKVALGLKKVKWLCIRTKNFLVASMAQNSSVLDPIGALWNRSWQSVSNSNCMGFCSWCLTGYTNRYQGTGRHCVIERTMTGRRLLQYHPSSWLQHAPRQLIIRQVNLPRHLVVIKCLLRSQWVSVLYVLLLLSSLVILFM